MKRILIVEDDAQRIYWFIGAFKGHALTITNCADHAIDAVSEREYDIIFLDHDLVGHDDLGCGRDFVAWLQVEMPECARRGYALPLPLSTTFVVHSVNFVSSSKITSELEALGFTVTRMPFPSLVVEGIAAL